jgi:hypothetical protein
MAQPIKTKGMQRRTAYVGAAIDAVVLSASIMYAWPWWVALLFVLFLLNNVHTLTTVGFTARANNEQ